jgi:hypothetical protein
MPMHLALSFPINIDLTFYSFFSPEYLDLILVSSLFLPDLDVYEIHRFFFRNFGGFLDL